MATVAGRTGLSLTGTARVFARIKLSLVRNEWKRGTSARLGLVLSWLGAVLVGVPIAVLAAVVDVSDPAVFRGYTLFAAVGGIVCVVGPIMIAGVSEAIGPDHLRPYPLSRSQQVVGLLTSALVGPVPLTGAIVLVGAVVGIARATGSAVSTLIAGGAATTYLLGALAASRLPSVLLSRILNSRRGRDAALVMASLLGIGIYGLQYAVRAADRLTDAAADRLVTVLRWLPPGALGRAVSFAAQGRDRDALPWLGIGVAGLLAVLLVWSIALRRMVGTVPAAAVARRGAVADEVLFDGFSAALPRTSIGAVAARELRYQIRDPRRRVQAVSALLMGLVWPIVNNLHSGEGEERTVLFATAACWLVVFGATNQFGLDGRAAWFDLSATTEPRRLFIGRNLALFVPGFSAAAVACVVLGAITGGWSYVPAAMAVSAAGMVAGLGGANLASVVAPLPVPEGSNPLKSAGAGQGCVSGLLYALALVLLTALLAPLVIAVAAFRSSAVACLAVGLFGLPYAGVAWWGLTSWASHLLSRRTPEIIRAVDPR